MRLIVAIPSLAGGVGAIKKQPVQLDGFDMAIAEERVQATAMALSRLWGIVPLGRQLSRAWSGEDVDAPLNVLKFSLLYTEIRVADGDHIPQHFYLGLERGTRCVVGCPFGAAKAQAAGGNRRHDTSPDVVAVTHPRFPTPTAFWFVGGTSKNCGSRNQSLSRTRFGSRTKASVSHQMRPRAGSSCRYCCKARSCAG